MKEGKGGEGRKRGRRLDSWRYEWIMWEERQESLELKCPCTLLYSSPLKPKENIEKASSSCIMTFKLFLIINMFTHIKYKRDSIIQATTHWSRRLVSKCSNNLMEALTELKAVGMRGRRKISERPLGGRVWSAVSLPMALLLVSSDSLAMEPLTGWILIWDMIVKQGSLGRGKTDCLPGWRKFNFY